jgi:phage baseplate assembly protein V
MRRNRNSDVQKMRRLFTRAKLTSSQADSPAQLLQLLLPGGVVLDQVEHIEPYGLTSRPHIASEAAVLSLGGNRNNSVAIVCGDRRYRLQGLAEGEVALYTDEGDKIHLQRGGNIAVVAKSKISFESPEGEFSGNLTIKGNASIEGDTTMGGNASVGGDASITGTSTAADHISGAVSGKSHVHSGVTSGGGSTAGPSV